jgi:antitoxin PrlF
MSKAMITVSPKFQIVIPKELREELQIEPGQQLLLYTLDGSIRVSPRQSIKDLPGFQGTPLRGDSVAGESLC